MKPAVDLDDDGDMEANAPTPDAGDSADLRFAALHSGGALIHRPGELLRHGVADVTPARQQGQVVDFMPD